MPPTLACRPSRSSVALGRRCHPPVLRRRTKTPHFEEDEQSAHGSRADTAIVQCLSQNKASQPTTTDLQRRAAISQAVFPRQIAGPLRVQQVRRVGKTLSSNSCVQSLSSNACSICEEHAHVHWQVSTGNAVESFRHIAMLRSSACGCLRAGLQCWRAYESRRGRRVEGSAAQGDSLQAPACSLTGIRCGPKGLSNTPKRPAIAVPQWRQCPLSSSP